MTPSQLYQKLTEAAKKGIEDSALKQQVASFLAFYENVVTQFQIDVSADLTVSMAATADDITADLKKYAGFDTGVLYASRLHELRTFATVNIYLGSVSLHPIDCWQLSPVDRAAGSNAEILIEPDADPVHERAVRSCATG